MGPNAHSKVAGDTQQGGRAGRQFPGMALGGRLKTKKFNKYKYKIPVPSME